MRVPTTPSAPPRAPQTTSIAFQASPSRDPLARCAISIAAEYAATISAPRNSARALDPSDVSAMNPTSAKAAMLYAFRNTTCQESAEGEVASYTALLVATQNSAAATTSVAALQRLRSEEEPS